MQAEQRDLPFIPVNAFFVKGNINIPYSSFERKRSKLHFFGERGSPHQIIFLWLDL